MITSAFSDLAYTKNIQLALYIGWRNATMWADAQRVTYNNEELGGDSSNQCRAITGGELLAKSKWSKVDCQERASNLFCCKA